MRENRASMLTGVGLGAGLMYFFDPARGARRRALMRDRLAHASRVAGDAAGATGRDVSHRAAGVAARLRGTVGQETVDDRVLLERVRSQIGRAVSHPRAIDADVVDGVVTLRGPILMDEVSDVIGAVEGVRGVRDVINNLDEHHEPGNVPALQGKRSPRRARAEMWQQQWSPTARLMTCTAGAALAGYGATRRDMAGVLAATAGIGMMARAATNVELRRLTGFGAGRRAIDVEKTIVIDAPVDEVFRFWSQYENFPRFMSRVLEVRPSAREGQSHWRVVGPGGVPVEFDAVVTAYVPNEVLAWRTVQGSAVAHAGIVRFEPRSDGRTRVHIRMSYNPPGGWVGHGVAAAFGVDPKRSLDEDLARLKTLIETGRPARDAAQPVY
jgi:uncharacterized membrane protein/osmotically-inducible protein OsmY